MIPATCAGLPLAGLDSGEAERKVYEMDGAVAVHTVAQDTTIVATVWRRGWDDRAQNRARN